MYRTLIREVTEKDTPGIADLLNELLEIMENLNNINKDKIAENILNAINDPNSCIFAAQTGDTLSGFIHLSFRHTVFHD